MGSSSSTSSNTSTSNNRTSTSSNQDNLSFLQNYKVLEEQLKETKTNLLRKEVRCRQLRQVIQALEHGNIRVRSETEMEHANFKRQIEDLVQQKGDLEKQVLQWSLDSGVANTSKEKPQRIVDVLRMVRDFQEYKLIEQHQRFQTIDAMLLEERNLKERATQRIDELQKHLDNSEKKLFNLEQKLKQDENEIKGQENQITLLNNKLIYEKNNILKFKVSEERKYQMTIIQLNDSRNKILDLTKQNQKLISKIAEMNAQYQTGLKQMTLEEHKNLKQIPKLKGDLSRAEEKITDLENVLEIYQTEERKYKMSITQLNDSRNKILDLTKENEKLTSEIEELKAQLQTDLKQMTLEQCNSFKQIHKLKDDLSGAEEKITDLESILQIYQTENMSTEDDLLLKDLKTTQILSAYNGIIDLKRRVDKVVQKSEFEIKGDRHKTYENQVKHLKSENQVMGASLNNIHLQKGKIETLEKNYFKLLHENNNRFTSLSKQLQNIMTLIQNIHQQFLFDTPAKHLRAVVEHGRALDKIEKINVEMLYQKERELLEEIIKALRDEREFLETMQRS